VAWEVEFTHQFEDWWNGLDGDQQEYMDAAIQLLQDKGPALGRPLVDTIKASIHANMKELRISKGGDLRVLFAFGPTRKAILLCGGDKQGDWDHWYKENVPFADGLFNGYLAELEKEAESGTP
jgi:hypothetical protein